jgi:lipopolysaccharide biosynthesis protein
VAAQKHQYFQAASERTSTEAIHPSPKHTTAPLNLLAENLRRTSVCQFAAITDRQIASSHRFSRQKKGTL